MEGKRAAWLTHTKLPAEEIEQRIEGIAARLLRSGHVSGGRNFTAIRPAALEFAFDAYDEAFFDGGCRSLLSAAGAPLSFDFSRRMTRTGGVTIRNEYPRRRNGRPDQRFQIKLSAVLLYQTFSDGQAAIVSGVRCGNRLEAMQRILEHEMIHLLEMLLWYDSSCSRSRFRGIASRFFGHTESTHQLITSVEVAYKQHGILPGDRVAFEHEGQRLSGRVNRITRRATVLVPNSRGTRYTDGKRYVKYYVPLARLKKLA